MNLKHTVYEFRKGILSDRDSDLMCFAVCAPLQAYLSMVGIETELVCGEVCKAEHYWLELEDGRIIDPTADQFNSPIMKMPKVYIGPRPLYYKTL